MPGLHEFWCPVNGLYFFTHTSVAYPNTQHAITQIWMDDSHIATSLTANGDTPSGSISIYVHCNAGSKVYVQCGYKHQCEMYGNVDGWENTVMFSGHLLSQDGINM